MTFREWPPASNGVGLEPSDVIGGGHSPCQQPEAAEDTLQAIRPCRESKSGWTRSVSSANHSSKNVNERGLALNAFWIPRCGIGCGLGSTRTPDHKH